MMDYSVDLNCVTDRLSLHEALIKSLPLPAYYGKTLDALYDILCEPHDEWNICFTGCTHAEQILGAYFDNLRATFEDARTEGAHLSFTWD